MHAWLHGQVVKPQNGSSQHDHALGVRSGSVDPAKPRGERRREPIDVVSHCPGKQAGKPIGDELPGRFRLTREPFDVGLRRRQVVLVPTPHWGEPDEYDHRLVLGIRRSVRPKRVQPLPKITQRAFRVRVMREFIGCGTTSGRHPCRSGRNVGGHRHRSAGVRFVVCHLRDARHGYAGAVDNRRRCRRLAQRKSADRRFLQRNRHTSKIPACRRALCRSVQR